MSYVIPSAQETQECGRCPLDESVPGVQIGRDGLCVLCRRFAHQYDVGVLAAELTAIRGLVGTGSRGHDALVGVSGGKDSTAALVRVQELGFTPLAFTFDTGYYPPHIPVRAAETAFGLGVDHAVVDLRGHVRPSDRTSFELTAQLYDQLESPALAARFRDLYAEGRARFSIRNDAPMPYVRVCQVCRRLVVRGYRREALAHGVRVVFLGTNEWAAIGSVLTCRADVLSGVRLLQPEPGDEPVYVVHLPFLARAHLDDTRAILERVGWKPPLGEDLVESNSNSCLLSGAAEAKAARLLGFHPDITRLAREATVGFLTREQAVQALTVHDHPRTVRDVLTDAGILP
jgi:hypothetical protein